MSSSVICSRGFAQDRGLARVNDLHHLGDLPDPVGDQRHTLLGQVQGTLVERRPSPRTARSAWPA